MHGPAVRRLLEETVGGTPYGESPLLVFQRALQGGSAESLAIVAADGDAALGIALYGLVAGSVAARLSLIAVTASARRSGVGSRLVEAAAEDAKSRGALLLVAEVPDEPVARPGVSLLEKSGFVLDGRVPDFHRDGVDLLLLRRDL